MERDQFVQMMIAELQCQQDSNAFNTPRSASAAEVYNKLCYDFPSVTTADICRLTEAIEACISNTKTVWSPNAAQLPVSLHSKFIENLHYLCSSPQAESDKAFMRSMGHLNATIFLKIPAFLLSCRKKQLNRIFSDARLPTLEEIEENENATGLPATLPANLSWADISLRFHQFVLSATASSICVGTQSGLVSADGRAAGVRSALMTGGHVEALCSAVKQLGDIINAPLETSSGSSGVQHRYREGLESPDGLDTLTDFLLAHMAVCPDYEAEAVQVPAIAADSTESTQGTPFSFTKEAWVHLVLLSRDVTIHSPELVVDGSFFLILAALRPPTETNTRIPRLSEFPTAAECLTVLLCSSLAASTLTESHHPSVAATLSLASSPDSDPTERGEPAESGSSVVEDTRLVVLKANQVRLAARSALRTQLDKAQALEGVVDICARMSKHAADGGAEASVLLADVCELYLRVGVAARIEALHARLLESRALAAIADTLVRATGLQAGPPLRALTPRLLEIIALAGLQNTATAGYLLRLPGLLSAILSSGWRNAEEVKRVDAAGCLPLCIGLLAGMAAKGQGATSSYSELKHVLLSALAALERDIVACSVSPSEEGTDADVPEGEAGSEITPERSDSDPSRFERKSRLPPQISSSINMAIFAHDAVSLLTRHDAQINKALIDWCATVLRAAEANGKSGKSRLDEIRRSCKALQSLLEGRGNKTD